MSRVFVVGSINMDVVATADRHPRSGETVTGGELHLFPGGKGANQAVAAHRADAETQLVSRLGKDDFGDRLEAFLRDAGLGLDHLEREPKLRTGTALVTVAGSQNTIVVVPGANSALRPVTYFRCRSPRGTWSLPSSRCRSRPSRPPFDTAARRGDNGAEPLAGHALQPAASGAGRCAGGERDRTRVLRPIPRQILLTSGQTRERPGRGRRRIMARPRKGRNEGEPTVG